MVEMAIERSADGVELGDQADLLPLLLGKAVVAELAEEIACGVDGLDVALLKSGRLGLASVGDQGFAGWPFHGSMMY